MDDSTALAAQNAAEALLALGWPVKTHGDEIGMWLIGDAILTGAELVSFAAWAPNPLLDEPPPSEEAAGRDQPTPSFEPIDALWSIRAIIDVATGPAVGTEVEPAIRLIRGILDGALPTHRHRNTNEAMTPPLGGRQLNAFRAVAGAPSGLRLGAHPSTMPLLVQMGLVEERDASRTSHPGGRAWFLTPAGRGVVKAYGADEG